MICMIATCKNPNCVSATQDALHGTGKRVLNQMKAGEYRCTACGFEQSVAKNTDQKAKSE